MKYFGVGNQPFINFFWRQAGISPRLAGKGKIPIAGSVQGYERQRGKNGGINKDAFGFDARVRHREGVMVLDFPGQEGVRAEGGRFRPLVASGPGANAAAAQRMIRRKLPVYADHRAEPAFKHGAQFFKGRAFREIADPSAPPPDVAEFTETIRVYMEDMLDCYGPEFAYVVARKSLLEFLRGRGYPGALRASISYLDSADALQRLLDAVAAGPTERYLENLNLHPESVERKLVRSHS